MTENKGNEEVQEAVETQELAEPKKSLAVSKPTNKDIVASKLHKNRVFARLIKDRDLLLRSEISRVAKERGLWNDDLQKELDEIKDKLGKGGSQLSRGGKTRSGEVFTRSEAKKLAFDMMEWRSRFLELRSVLHEFDKYTIESQAEDEEFNFLCSLCIEGVKDLQDYNDRAEELEEEARELAKITNNYDDSWYDKLPEIAFLKKYKFIDDKYRLINEDGKLIDDDGKLISEDGRLIDEQGELVNEFGEKVDEDGNILDFVEFPD